MLLLPITLMAQKEFPKVWEGKFNVEARWKIYSPDLTYLIGGDMSEVQVLEGATGKSLWVYNFKEQLGVKKCETWTTDHDTESIEVIIEKGKDGTRESVHLDYRTGAVVAQKDLAARTKEKVKVKRSRFRKSHISQTQCYDEATNTTIDLEYENKRNIGAKNGRELELTVEASGGKAWRTTFTGRVVSRLTQMYLSADEGDVILDIMTSHGKVFVIYEGISCLDLATGKVLWNTTFDNVEFSSGLKAKQEIGRSAMPLVAVDGVYICDFTKGERAIKKLDVNTGAVIWQADKLKKDDIVSALVLDGGNLIARFGGVIRVEQYIPGMNGNPDVYKAEYVFEGTTSLRAYNAGTGQMAWHTADMDLPDNFKKSECNILNADGKVFACGEKNLYIFDAATGALVKQGEYNAKEVGKAKAIYTYDGAYIVEGEKGLARLNADLGQIYATNTGKCLMTEVRGEAFIVWTGKDFDDRKQFVRFDPATGAILGIIKDCPNPYFNFEGDRFVKFDGQKVMQYRTN